MQFSSERLIARPPTQADAEDLFRIYGDPETNRLNPEGPFPDLAYSVAVMAAWVRHWETHGFGYWAIATRAAPERLVGFGGLRIRDFHGKPINNLGYHFSLEAWGQGFATEFARFALDHGFVQAGLDIVTALVRENHPASRRVLEKLGFHHSERKVDPNDPPPLLVYHLDRDQWTQARAGTRST